MTALAILLLEDDCLTAADIKEALEQAGHRLIGIARNYQEASAAIQQEMPDLAIIDIHLGPDTDGITVVQQLLKTCWIPVIYLTAHSESLTFQRAKQTAPAAYLLKPFRQNELAFQVELAYMNQRRDQSDLNTFTSDTLYLPMNKSYDQLKKDEVLYLQASGAYVKVFTVHEPKPYLLSMHLGHLAQYFVTPNFFRLSRSLLINLDHVSRIDTNQVLINDRVQLAISEGSRTALLNKLPIVRTR